MILFNIIFLGDFAMDGILNVTLRANIKIFMFIVHFVKKFTKEKTSCENTCLKNTQLWETFKQDHQR